MDARWYGIGNIKLRGNNMEKIKLTHWRGKLINEMSKEELIEALTDSHHLWREANERGVQDLVDVACNLSRRRNDNAGGLILMGVVIACLVIFIGGFLLS